MARFLVSTLISLLSALLVSSSACCLEPERHMHIGVLFPGVVVDKDFNELGYQAISRASESLGIKATYRQRVSPAEAVKTIKELADSGCTVIWGHGGQYFEAILASSAQYPEISFITEAESPLTEDASNVHVLGREYHKGFYVLGALAAKTTKTGIIGYIGGMPQPFSWAQVNAALFAIKQYNPKVVLKQVFVGDFNDPMHARQAAEVFILEGCDVLLSGVNMGNFGIIDAVNSSTKPVLFTTIYTNKHAFSPDRYLTSDMFDFSGPIEEILGRISRGMRNGFVPMAWGEDKARYTLFPIDNVPPAVDQEMRDIANKIAKGEIIVPNDMSPVSFDR